MKKLLLLVACVAMFGFANATETMTIEKATKVPKVDGNITSADPWGTTWITLAKRNSASTSSDITAKFQLMYDDVNLYLIASVTGNKNLDTTSTTTHTNDCLEVFVKLDTSCYPAAGAGKYIAGDFQLRERAGSVFPDRYDIGTGGVTTNGASNALILSTFQVGQAMNGNDFQQEWLMPWSTLMTGMTKAWDLKEIRFDIQAADVTGAVGNRSQQMYWNDNSDSQWNNTTKFGLVTLRTPVGINKPAISEKVNFTVVNNEVLRASMNLDLTVVNMAGQVVANVKNASELNISSYAKGVYVVKGVKNGKTVVQKFEKR